MQIAIGYLICNDRFYEAFDVARDVGVTTVAIKTIGPDKNEYLVHGFDAYNVLGEKPNERWEEAEYYTALLGLIPVMFRISTVKLTDSAQAANSANLVARACREVAQVSAIPDLWNSAAKLFEEIFTEEIDPEELIARGKRFDVNLQLALKTICYVRASLECAPHGALEIHLAIMPYLSKHFLSFVSLYRQTLVPFLQTFWLKTVRENGFYFSNPRKVEAELEQMVGAHHKTTVQNLLSIITTGLAVQIDEDTSRWLGQR